MKVKEHPRLHRSWIDRDALEIVEQLQEDGYLAYLVGGCVRDLLAGCHPKDFDIATSALPEQVKRSVNRAYIIGRRFRLVLVRRGEKQFEVATFRKEAEKIIPSPGSENEEEVPFGDNVFGSPEEDAQRRDFTINSMFYDPVNDKLIDYCEGIRDIEDRSISIIGDPDVRLKEDPIRILRALRLAHKLRFRIEPSLRAAIQRNAAELERSVLPRKREEILKILRLKDPARTLHEAHDLGILKHLCPTLGDLFNHPDQVEEFDHYLRRFHDFVENSSIPAELFGVLILAWWRTVRSPDPNEIPSPPEFLVQTDIKYFLRDQLGMSNLEQSLVAHALYLQPYLKDLDKIKKRGKRRQMNLLKHDAFLLAFKLACEDHVLSPAEIQFWQDAYQEASHEIGRDREERQERKRPPRRRNRTRQPAP